MKKIKRVITLIVVILCLNGCTQTEEVQHVRNTDISRTIVITNVEEYKTSLLNLIRTGEKNSLCTEEFEFLDDDILSEANINNSYIFNNAIYIQTNNEYMYRFQLNNYTKLVESYIRYQLEG